MISHCYPQQKVCHNTSNVFLYAASHYFILYINCIRMSNDDWNWRLIDNYLGQSWLWTAINDNISQKIHLIWLMESKEHRIYFFHLQSFHLTQSTYQFAYHMQISYSRCFLLPHDVYNCRLIPWTYDYAPAHDHCLFYIFF